MKSLKRISGKLYDLLDSHGRGSIFFKKEAANKLFVNLDVKKEIREKSTTLISRLILILIGTACVCVMLAVGEKSVLGEDGSLERPGVGEGDRIYELEVSVDGSEYEKVPVGVTEREVPAELIPGVFDEAERLLSETIKGNNPSLDRVEESLDLVDAIRGSKVTVMWEADREGFFSKTGRIRIVPSQPEEVVLFATLHYFEHSRRIPVPVTIVPPETVENGGQDREKTALQNEISAADSRDPSGDRVFLPEEAGEEKLGWREPTDTRPIMIAAFGVIAAVIMVVRAGSSVRDEEKKRKEQMEKDYPEIVSKLILLLTAGMTISGAWKRICNDYLEAKPRLGKRFAYEEMVFSMRELELGRSEAVVYEAFGSRTEIVCYKRLSAMLSRNLRRGFKEILAMLDLESRDAYAARFEAVRKKGEETSTKLLFPMMGMLVIVIAIIIVPAFMGMSI